MSKWRVTIAGDGLSESMGHELVQTQLISAHLIMWSFEGNPSVTIIDIQVEAPSETEAGDQALGMVNRGAEALGFHLDHAMVRTVRELTKDLEAGG
jgi:hypothetical protein